VIAGTDLQIFQRSIGQATSRHTGPALDEALAETGWHDALAADSYTAIETLFPRQGAVNATSSALDHVIAFGLGLRLQTEQAVVLPTLGGWTLPGGTDGRGLTVEGLGTSAMGRARTALVVSRTAQLPALTVATVDASACVLTPAHGMDPEFGLVKVTAGEAQPMDEIDTVTERWSAAVGLAQVAIGHELAGASRAMLELARVHALNRVQFGRPISRFQAVRHRLAETLVAIEAAEAMLAAAGDDGSPEVAAVAKALAGRGALVAGRHCQQVLAGVGFTAEHPFHRYLRRVLLLDQLFGTARALREALGQQIVAGGQLPELLPL
jgi:hypothetical protein